MLYTTVTLSDFKDTNYINQLLKLNIGMELAILANLPLVLNPTHYQKDLDALKKEVMEFKTVFEDFGIDISKIRIHQPGGYSYYWFSENNVTGFDLLKDLFYFCRDIGFKNWTIHGPCGNTDIDFDLELAVFQEKLKALASIASVEVEEIVTSCAEFEVESNIRCYNGDLLEKLLGGQKATILLDTYECGGVEKTVKRMHDLARKGFKMQSVHIHKDKHKFLSVDELALLLESGFTGNIINEAFVKSDSRFEEFMKTKSADCVVPNDERIEILSQYKNRLTK